MKQLIHRHTISFYHAFSGLFWAISTQPNYIVHIFLSLLSLGAAWYFHIAPYEFLTILVLITMGFMMETVNTALEQALDCVSLERRADIKIAKDVAAGAMLIFAIGAGLIASYIFIPYII